MATVPVPRTWVTNENVTATIMNGTTGVKGVHDFMLAPPRVSVYQTATTNMATSGTAALLLFDTEAWDTDSCHSVLSNTSQLLATTTGLYSVTFNVHFAANATGVRTVEMRKNAGGSSGAGTSIVIARSAAGATSATTVGLTLDVPLVASDTLELFGTQTSGGALSTVGGTAGTIFAMRWVALS